MYDPMDDEITLMDEREKQKTGKFIKAFKLSDTIESIYKHHDIILDEDTSIHTTITKMKEEHLGCVLVVKDGILTGIFTERDLLYKVTGNRLDFKKELIKDYMTPNPHTLRLDDSIAFALNIMVDGGFRNIPLVDNDQKPTGMICMKTVVNHIGEFFHDEIMNLPPKPLRKQVQRHGG